MAKIKVIDKSIVDGKPWYQILCDSQVADWLAKRGSAYHIGYHRIWSIYDMPESTYIMMKLVWSD